MTTIEEKSAPANLASYTTDKELFAARYTQGGRTVFNVAMTPAQIAAAVKRPNPDAENPGNRRIRLDHAQAFARYFIEHDAWVVPGIILRAPSIFTFTQDFEVPDAQFGTVKYAERNQGDIHILDGQHRILGFHIALEQVDEQIDKARSARATARRVEDPVAAREQEAAIARLEKVRDRLYKERVSVEIQVTDDLQAYRQMFFDIAENALGITASVKARFDSRKVVNRALPAVLEHPLLAGRIDLEVDRIPRKSTNLLTARHIMETMRVLTVGFDGRVSRRQDKEMNEVDIARDSNTFFTALTDAFPALKSVERGQLLPDMLRETSMLGSPLFIRILAGAYHELTKNHAFSKDMAEGYLAKLAKHVNAPAHANSIWKLYAEPEAFNLDSWSPNGRRQDAKGLVDTLVAWALDREPFLDAEPLDPPVVEVDPDEGIDFAFDHDTKALEVEERNALEEIATQAKKRVARKK